MRWIGVALLVLAAAGLLSVEAITGQAAETTPGPALGPLALQTSDHPTPTPIPPELDERIPVAFDATGQVLVSEHKAIDIAGRLADGAATRQAIGLVTYSEAARWMGSYTYTYHPDRKMYLVVNQAEFRAKTGLLPVSCKWYFALIDAVSGRVSAHGCTDRTSSWPPSLPEGVEERSFTAP